MATLCAHTIAFLLGGRGFLRTEQVFLDAGTFDTNDQGRHRESFGYCAAMQEGCGTALVEKRVSNHLVLGAGFDIQKSEDYTPSRAMLYLRYSFAPWRGPLPLGPEPLTPYGEFR